jgi:hypothetical protein
MPPSEIASYSDEEKLLALDAAIRYFDNLVGDENFKKHRAVLTQLFEELTARKVS